MADKKIFRILDANFNRAKEALRVIEDASRFVWEDKNLTLRTRRLRHRLTDIFNNTGFLRKMLAQRESDTDIGKKTDKLELKRKDIDSVVFANLQRAKESLRVLEETTKLVQKNYVAPIKGLRYKCYSLEKHVQKKKSTIRHT